MMKVTTFRKHRWVDVFCERVASQNRWWFIAKLHGCSQKKVDILHSRMLPKELDYFLKIRVYNDGPNIRLKMTGIHLCR